MQSSSKPIPPNYHKILWLVVKDILANQAFLYARSSFCVSLHWQAVSSVDSRLVLLVTKCKPRLSCSPRFLRIVEQSNVNPWCKCKTMSLYHVLCFYVVKWLSYFSDTAQISLTWATFVIAFFHWELCLMFKGKKLCRLDLIPHFWRPHAYNNNILLYAYVYG